MRKKEREREKKRGSERERGRERERETIHSVWGIDIFHDPWNVTRPHRRYYERRGGWIFGSFTPRNVVGESVRGGGGSFLLDLGWILLRGGREEGTKGFGNVRFIS